MDSSQFMVHAKNQKGQTGVVLVLKPELIPKPKHIPIHSSSLHFGKYMGKQPADNTFYFINKAEHRSHYDEDMKIINLSEVILKAQIQDKRDEVKLTNWATGGDIVINREEIDKRNPTKISELLLPYRASFRNALIVIDGIPMTTF